MLDSLRTVTATSAQQMNPSDEINQPLPGRLSCDNYVSYNTIGDYGNRVRRSAEYYAKFRQSLSGRLVAAAPDDEESEFGFSTPPPVWGPTNPSAIPPHRNNNNKNNDYGNLSPAWKAQAIARGQRELMEMVSKMPESCYELSLKDLVEKQPVVEEKQKQEQESDQKGVKKMNDKKMEILNKKKKNESTVRNNNEGFLLKMVFPAAFGMKNKDKKKKNKSESRSYSFKVAPRPPVVDEIEGSHKAVDKEWWEKGSERSESESYGSSSNNGSGKNSVSINSISSHGRNSSRYGTGCSCFCFIRKKKIKNVQ